MAIPIDSTVFTLANLARAAAIRGQGAFSEFYRNLTEIEQVQLREIGTELAALASPLPDFVHPVDAANSAFSKLVWKTETSLNRHDARQVFSKWLETLGPKLDKKSGVIIRLLTMRPGPNVAKLAREMAKENEVAPPGKRHGWDSTNETTLRRLIFREMQFRGAK